MIPNTSITAIRTVTGALSDGRPLLTAIAVAVPILVTITEPSDRIVRDAQARGVNAERLLTVTAAPFNMLNYSPRPGDRITISWQDPGQTAIVETREVVASKRSRVGFDGSIDSYVLTLDKAEDNA